MTLGPERTVIRGQQAGLSRWWSPMTDPCHSPFHAWGSWQAARAGRSRFYPRRSLTRQQRKPTERDRRRRRRPQWLDTTQKDDGGPRSRRRRQTRIRDFCTEACRPRLVRGQALATMKLPVPWSDNPLYWEVESRARRTSPPTPCSRSAPATDAHREQETPATPCPGIQKAITTSTAATADTPVATPCPLRKAIEDEIKAVPQSPAAGAGLSRTGVANRWATIAERMENLLREHGDCGRAPATLTPRARKSRHRDCEVGGADLAECRNEGLQRWRCKRNGCGKRNALRTLVEKQREALRNVLNRAEQLFSSDRPPPKSCGRCGTPNASCDGDCVDAAYIADDLWKVHAVPQRRCPVSECPPE